MSTPDHDMEKKLFALIFEGVDVVSPEAAARAEILGMDKKADFNALLNRPRYFRADAFAATATTLSTPRILRANPLRPARLGASLRTTASFGSRL